MELTGWEEANRVNQACEDLLLDCCSSRALTDPSSRSSSGSVASKPRNNAMPHNLFVCAVVRRSVGLGSCKECNACAARGCRHRVATDRCASPGGCSGVMQQVVHLRSCVEFASRLYKAAQQSVLRRGAGTTFMRRT